MWMVFKRSLMAAALVAMVPVLRADDAEVAAKLVGTWEGRWEYGDMGGKLVVKITGATGNALKGESKWFGTAVGDFPDAFKKATVKGNVVTFPEPTMDFEGTLSEDLLSMKGTWTSPVATGKLTLKKLAEPPTR